ncbi:hypothetical protein BJP62_03885 [Jeongeupia sp. USM3]|nr:hypothetical protein BJP62_03885 [Jeongeupia sp. USM3]
MQAELQQLLARHSWGCGFRSLSPPPGMYLTLHHGRHAKDEELDDWGFDGPRIGPIDWAHITYLDSINLGFSDGGETGPMYGADPLRFEQDMLFYAGCWYGDWEIQWLGAKPAA